MSGIRSDGVIGIQVEEACLKRKDGPRNIRLANFNDIHCVYHTELNLVIMSLISGSSSVDLL